MRDVSDQRTGVREERRILVLGGGGAAEHMVDWSDRVVRAARRRGLALEVSSPADELARLRDESLALARESDFADAQAAIALARERAARPGAPLLGLTCFRELGVEPAALAAEAVGLAWNSVAAVRTVRHKERCRARLREAGLPQPDCRSFEARADAARFLRSEPGPWVVKPSDSLGSQGVSIVREPAQAESALALAEPFAPPFLVERFVEGPEYSAEGVFVGGEPHVVAFTQKRLAPQPYFVTLGHVMPAELDRDAGERAAAAVRAALAAVGLTHSPFHVEFWVTPGGEIVLGEMHARPGGDWIHLLVDACYGVDLFDVAIADLAGDAAVPAPIADGAVASAVAVPPRSGTLERIDGLDEVRADPRCLHVDVKRRPGDAVTGELRSHFERMALVIARGADRRSAAAAAGELAGRLTAEVS